MSSVLEGRNKEFPEQFPKREKRYTKGLLSEEKETERHIQN
jgi:hypothetical protein